MGAGACEARRQRSHSPPAVSPLACKVFPSWAPAATDAPRCRQRSRSERTQSRILSCPVSAAWDRGEGQRPPLTLPRSLMAPPPQAVEVQRVQLLEPTEAASGSGRLYANALDVRRTLFTKHLSLLVQDCFIGFCR